MKKRWRVEIRGSATFTVDNEDVRASGGLYIMEEADGGLYELSRGSENTFKLSPMTLTRHMAHGDLNFPDHDWPQYQDDRRILARRAIK